MLGFLLVLLLRARYRPGSYRGASLLPGQLAVTCAELALQTGMSEKQVRVAMGKLVKLGLIQADQRAHRFTVITILEPMDYGVPSDTERPTTGQTEGEPRADRGQTNGFNPLTPNGLSARKKERNKKTETCADPRTKPLGDMLSGAYRLKTGLPFPAEAQMRRDIKRLLAAGKTVDEVVAAYTAFLESKEPFYSDHSWGKFQGWWAANTDAHLPHERGPFGRTR